MTRHGKRFYDGVAYYMRDPHDPSEEVKRFHTTVDATDNDEASHLVENAWLALVDDSWVDDSGDGMVLMNWYVREVRSDVLREEEVPS
jgi:hypothetical protein